jgi:hypothetical protein
MATTIPHKFNIVLFQCHFRNIPNEFGGLTHARVKKLNPHANTPAAVKMNEINPKYENTLTIHRLLTN